ncbi:helix-turn-helix domain-containing protein [Hymenobacter sp. J193]|uniref:helix-turn-helix domain-containing protein n=1 Tax=Hymenobacter sp. J193 TaxID=2898429 RepID=UPI002151DB29|nr:helix-turn-helix domain-containing protein [Hymenobacter sp. J193]MCR5889449.1 helix-turn-helix domain-containing protein [Hymenobacter sp. J193]
MQTPIILTDPDALRELIRSTLLELLPTTPPATNSVPQLMTMAETCREFGVSKTTLGEWRKNGIVPFVRLGRRVYFERARVLEAGRSHLRYQRKG